MGCGQEAAELRAQDKEPFEGKEHFTGKPDMVNHPPHYTGAKIECIDALQEATKHLNGIEAVCTANAIKYLWRWKKKNGKEDLKKAVWYIEHMINSMP